MRALWCDVLGQKVSRVARHAPRLDAKYLWVMRDCECCQGTRPVVLSPSLGHLQAHSLKHMTVYKSEQHER
jgi:hypothetical protein